MTVGANAVTVNNKEVQLDAPAVIVNGRTLAPARFVAETFGYTVQWDAENKIVKINGKESSTETTTETTTVTTTETSTETTTESTTETTTKATATSSSKKYYDEYSDVLDYGTFSGANLVDKMTVELSDFKSHSYIYDFKYDEEKEEYIYEFFSEILKDQYGNEKEVCWLKKDSVSEVYECLDETVQAMIPVISKIIYCAI